MLKLKKEKNRKEENRKFSHGSFLKKNCKGQTGETIAWVIATLVIIGVLIIFIYISTIMGKAKNLTIGDINSDLSKKSVVLSEKTSLAHALSQDKNKEEINKIILQYDK
jgi:hypothetical protein